MVCWKTEEIHSLIPYTQIVLLTPIDHFQDIPMDSQTMVIKHIICHCFSLWRHNESTWNITKQSANNFWCHNEKQQQCMCKIKVLNGRVPVTWKWTIDFWLWDQR